MSKMSLKYSGSEKGLKLAPKGVEHYSDLLSKTALQLSIEVEADPEKTVFSIEDKRELLDGLIAVDISIPESLIESYTGKNLMFAVIVKESASRSSRVAYKSSLESAIKKSLIEIEKESLSDLAFTSSVYIDVLVYEDSLEYGYLVQALKRCTHSGGGVDLS